MNKCKKTVTGKHYFEDGSFEVCSIEPPHVGGKLKCTKVPRDIVCRYCGLVDDRKK